MPAKIVILLNAVPRTREYIFAQYGVGLPHYQGQMVFEFLLLTDKLKMNEDLRELYAKTKEEGFYTEVSGQSLPGYLEENRPDFLITNLSNVLRHKALFHKVSTMTPLAILDLKKVPQIHKTSLSKKIKYFLHLQKTKRYLNTIDIHSVHVIHPDHANYVGRKHASKVRLSPSFDFHRISQSVDDEAPIDQLVFVDTNLGAHPINKLHLDEPIDEDAYLSKLANGLKQIAQTTQKKICLALHPTSNKEAFEHKLPGVEITQFKTETVIRRSSGVICHGSTALVYAAYYQKPVIMLWSEELARINLKYYFHNWTEQLGAGLYDLEEQQFDQPFSPAIDHKRYDACVSHYMKPASSKECYLDDLLRPVSAE